MIDEEVQREAIALARGAIAHALGGPAPARPRSAFFDDPHPAFVTLHRMGSAGAGELHGCIGSFASRPLAETLPRAAVSAAFEDPRATPLAPDALGELDLEVSFLSPATPISFRTEEEARAALRPGVDGVTLRYRPRHGAERHGLFLPQVWQSLPEPRHFLDELKRKAGLPRDFWAPEVALERFTVEVVHDPAPAAREPSAARWS